MTVTTATTATTVLTEITVKAEIDAMDFDDYDDCNGCNDCDQSDGLTWGSLPRDEDKMMIVATKMSKSNVAEIRCDACDDFMVWCLWRPNTGCGSNIEAEMFAIEGRENS